MTMSRTIDTVYTLHLPSGPQKFYTEKSARQAAKVARKGRLPGTLYRTVRHADDADDTTTTLEDWGIS